MVNLHRIHKACAALLHDLEEDGVPRKHLRQMQEIEAALGELRAAEAGSDTRESLPEVLFRHFKEALDSCSIVSGTVAEIGGAKNSLLHRLSGFEACFLSLYPSSESRMVVADITNCPHIPDASFEAIYSISVLEHVTRIHDAAREIVRLLKPGGITAHAVPFSYFFHGAPVDFWRVTPSALESLFDELETITCFFFSDSRRRNNLGSPQNPIDRDGGPQFAPDAFGGWRENWHSVYVGRKPHDSQKLLLERRRSQTIIDIVKGLKEREISQADAFAHAQRLIGHISFGDHGRILVSAMPLSDAPAITEIETLWKDRKNGTLKPGSGRHNLMELLNAKGLLEIPTTTERQSLSDRTSPAG